MVQGVLDTLGDDWTLKRMVYDNENKYEFPSFGNHLQKEAVTAASAARWEALVVCIRV